LLAPKLDGESAMHQMKSNDARRVIEFSLQFPIEAAYERFPELLRRQIQTIYALDVAERDLLLAEDCSKESDQHIVRAGGLHRSPAQLAKMRQQATDPANS
jgi:hypothetical protein